MKLITPKFWQNKNSILSILLSPLALIYSFISETIQYLQTKQTYKSTTKIITIGNITLGGAGKTPVVLSIAKILHNNTKLKIAALTRGYKGELLGPIMLEHTHSIHEVGDEALLLGKEIDTCIAKDRLAGIKFLESQGYDIIITDDGMQDMRFKKNLTIMVVDSLFGFGNQKVFPAGPLREPLNSGINKADLIVMIGKNNNLTDLDKPLIKANILSKYLLNNEQYIAFAGIGNPEKFFNSVIEAEGILIEKIAFPDHHLYTDRELKDLIKLAISKKAKLITTEKDFTRINDNFKTHITTLPISLIWEKEDQLLEKLLNL